MSSKTEVSHIITVKGVKPRSLSVYCCIPLHLTMASFNWTIVLFASEGITWLLLVSFLPTEAREAPLSGSSSLY
jgi:hypothetical protein